MNDILDLLGQNVATPESRFLLSRYPSLRTEIEDTGFGGEGDAVHYLRSEDDGLLIKCTPDGDVVAIFLMSEGHDDFEQFDGKLPGNLTFDSTPADAERAFGKPAFQRPASKIGQTSVGALLRFDWPTRSIHFLFWPDGVGIVQVTAMIPKAVPGRSHVQPG